MKARKIDAVKLKRKLQHQAEKHLSSLTEREQVEFLRKRYGQVSKPKHAAIGESMVKYRSRVEKK